MKSKIRISALVLVLYIAMTSMTCFASYYETTFKISADYNGETRYYDGNNITFSASAYSLDQTTNMPTTYKVTLMRKNFILSDDKIGSKDFPRNSFDSVTWSNVGPGKYYIRFTRSRDNTYTKGYNVKIYN